MSTSMTAPQRRTPLEGASNFRDLGGYEAADGRTVKWRHLYRSNSLAALTDADLEQIAALGIRLVCDLRREEESVEAPSRSLAGLSAEERARRALAATRRVVGA